jgi:hypothetical protein
VKVASKKSVQGKSPAKLTAVAKSPSLLGTEQTMRDILRLLQGKDFGSLEQMNKYLATLTGGGLQEALELVSYIALWLRRNA